jgi:hypothetical protein
LGYTAFTEVRIGVDPAISQSDIADYTAIVPGLILEVEDGYMMYILPKIINRRLPFQKTIEICKIMFKVIKKIIIIPNS